MSARSTGILKGVYSLMKFHQTTFVTIVVLISIALGLSGCFTVGKSFPGYVVPDIKVGEADQNKISDMFGAPWRTGMDNGVRTWTYGLYRYSLFSAAKTEDLVIRFNSEGVVTSYTYNTTDPLP